MTSYIIAARRSAVVPKNGAFADLSLHELATPIALQTLKDSGLELEDINELILSNALGAGGNPARSVALAMGLPEHVAGLSVDRQCAGGLDALLLADALIRSGHHDVILAGGVESYSRRPLRYETFSDGRSPQAYDQAPFTPWPNRNPDMAEAADALARSLNISRDAQDLWAINSHEKALRIAPTELAEEIVSLNGLNKDPFTRALNPKLCARAKTICGSITAANMAVAADAAAFVLVVSERVARKINASAITLVDGKTLGGQPELPGLAPVAAIKAVLSATKTSPATLSAVEIMEAFAVQAIACQQQSGLPEEVTNLSGGALARGHPIGASGASLAVQLYHRLRRKGGSGLAAIAAAGGLGTALLMRSE